jgi:LysM repeat protein
MKKLCLLAVLFFAATSHNFAQSSQTIRDYILKFKDVAIEEMQRTGVPASITLAQGIHETGAGTSDLVLRSNNHFGIKCKTEWTGPAVYHDDDARGECFRKYEDPIQSYKDHSDFLKNRPYYASLFKLDPLDYKNWAYGLKKAGYATNPKYPQILIKLIEDYNLQDYSLIALNEKSPESNDVIWAKNSNTDEAEIKTEKKDLKLLYPSGLFKINETKVLLVLKGTSYLKIAEEHDLSISRLFEFNDMQEQDIANDDLLIFLQRKRKVGSSEFHVVAEGETVHDIAQTEGVRLDQLMEYNFLKTGMQPKAGEKIFLQGKAPSMPQIVSADRNFVAAVVTKTVPITGAPETTPQNDFLVHTVQAKETAYAISKKYGVAIEDIRKWNNLQTIELKIGQELRIKKPD